MSTTLEAPPATVAAAPAPAPAAPVVPAAPVPPTPGFDTFAADSANVLPDALISLIPPPAPIKRPGATPTPPPAAVAPVAPAAPAAPSPATAPVVTPPAAATPSAPTPEPAKPSEPLLDANGQPIAKNWRMTAKDAKEAMVLQLVRQGAPMLDAVSEVYGKPENAAPAAAATPATPEPPRPDPVAPVEARIKTLAAEVASIETDMDKAVETNDLAALNKLSKQFTAKQLELSNEQNRRAYIQQSTQDAEVNQRVETHRQLETQNVTKAIELYPKLSEAKSPERAQFNLKVAELERDPSFGPHFRQTMPGWPMVVASMVAEQQGWSRQAPAAVVAPVAPVPVAPTPSPSTMPTPSPVQPVAAFQPSRATAVELVSPNAIPGGQPPPASIESFHKDAANATPEQLLALFASAPLPTKLLEMQRKVALNKLGRR
jgi:hypothetical protein